MPSMFPPIKVLSALRQAISALNRSDDQLYLELDQRNDWEINAYKNGETPVLLKMMNGHFRVSRSRFGIGRDT